MPNSLKVRDPFWDNLKGILILFVICGHLCERYIDDSNFLRHIWILVYSFHMPLFIFVNGYFVRKSSKPAEEKSLLMLKYYLLMQVLFMIGNYLVLGQDFKLSLLAQPAYCCWYLLFLVYAYLFVKIMPADRRTLIKWILVSVLFSLLVGFDISVGFSYSIGRTFYFMPWFLLGAFWANYGNKLNFSVKRKIVCICGGIILGVILWSLGDAEWFNRAVLSGYMSYESLYPGHVLFGLANKLGAYCIALCWTYIILHLIPRKKTFLSIIGKHTLLIYLVHIFVLPMEFHLIRNMVFTDVKELNSLIILLILAVSSLGLSFLLFSLFRFIKLKNC